MNIYRFVWLFSVVIVSSNLCAGAEEVLPTTQFGGCSSLHEPDANEELAVFGSPEVTLYPELYENTGSSSNGASNRASDSSVIIDISEEIGAVAAGTEISLDIDAMNSGASVLPGSGNNEVRILMPRALPNDEQKSDACLRCHWGCVDCLEDCREDCEACLERERAMLPHTYTFGVAGSQMLMAGCRIPERLLYSLALGGSGLALSFAGDALQESAPHFGVVFHVLGWGCRGAGAVEFSMGATAAFRCGLHGLKGVRTLMVKANGGATNEF